MKQTILFIFIILLIAGCGGDESGPDYMDAARDAGGSAITYDQNTSPALTDEMLGIDAPGGVWSINRFPLSDILALGLEATPTDGEDAKAVDSDYIYDLVNTTLPLYLQITDLEGAPTEDEYEKAPTSEWAYDHVDGADPHTGYMLESNIGTGANNYVQLNGSAELPAVDGSNLTNVTGTISDLDDLPDDDTDNDLVDYDILQQVAQNPLSSAPGTPFNGQVECADGDNWQPGSTDQGTDDWLVIYRTSDTSWVGVYNITDGEFIDDGTICLEPVILAEPDALQPISDAWPLYSFPAEKYPDGFSVEAIHIWSSATDTDALNFEEWSNNGTAWSTDATVEAITMSGVFTEDDGTLSDSDIAADASLFVDLPASPTDVAWIKVQVCGKIK